MKVSGIRFRRALWAFFLCCPLLLGAEEKSKIYVFPLVSDGFNDEEVKSIEYLLFSYLKDIGIIAEEPEQDIDTLAGRLRLDENSRFLDLEIIKPSGERYFSSHPFKNSGELVLKVRSLLSAAFQKDQKNQEIPDGTQGEKISREAVSGTWRSVGSIQMMRLERDGTGMLLFSSGAVMKLIYAVEDNVLVAAQDSANNERFYHPLPHAVARSLAEKAEPMRWELKLFDRGTVLRGTVFFTEAVSGEDGLITLNPGRTAAVEWQKSR